MCPYDRTIDHGPIFHMCRIVRVCAPRDLRSFSPGWAVGQEEDSGFWSAPSRGHNPLFIMNLRSAMEEDKNLGSLLPARCCCKAHTSTRSSLYSFSSSKLLYIVIAFLGISCPYIFFVALSLLVGVVAGTGFFSSSCRCSRVDRLDASPPQLLSPLVPSLSFGSDSQPFTSLEIYPFMVTFSVAVGSYVSLVALVCSVSGGRVSEIVVVEVPWSWITMFRSSSGCSPLLLFDAWRLLFAILRSLLIVVIWRVYHRFFYLVLRSHCDCPCRRFHVDCRCPGVLPLRVALRRYLVSANFSPLSPVWPHVVTLLCVGQGTGKFELAMPVFR